MRPDPQSGGRGDAAMVWQAAPGVVRSAPPPSEAPDRTMKLEWHPALILVVLLLGGFAYVSFHYGTANRCQMLRQEVRMRFPGQVPADVRDSPGGQLVVGIVEGGPGRFLTYDLSPNECMLKLPRLWFAEDTELGGILLDGAE